MGTSWNSYGKISSDFVQNFMISTRNWNRPISKSRIPWRETIKVTRGAAVAWTSHRADQWKRGMAGRLGTTGDDWDPLIATGPLGGFTTNMKSSQKL